MSTNRSDIADRLIQLLQAAGYAVHEGEADDRPDLGMSARWFTRAPQVGDIETGPTCTDEQGAWLSAAEQFFANATIPTYTSDENDEAAPVALAIPLLQRCEAFIAGFEDDDTQDGVPVLLAAVRAVIGDRSEVAPELPSEAALCDELEAYCEAHGLPFKSADELLAELEDDQHVSDVLQNSIHREWLRDYCERWDRWEECAKELAAALGALGQAEGWALFNDDRDLQRDDEQNRFASDDDAHAYVTRMAAVGSPVHAYALARLAAGARPRGPFYVMIDGEQTVAECTTLSDARIDGRALADAEPIPCTFAIHDADGNHVEDIERTDHAALPGLVKAFDAKHAPRSHVWEVTAAGFDGGTDDTDDRVYWVRADSEQQVAEVIADTGAKLHDELPIGHADNDIDFDLTQPGQAMQFGTKLLEWASHERNKNRAV